MGNFCGGSGKVKSLGRKEDYAPTGLEVDDVSFGGTSCTRPYGDGALSGLKGGFGVGRVAPALSKMAPFQGLKVGLVWDKLHPPLGRWRPFRAQG